MIFFHVVVLIKIGSSIVGEAHGGIQIFLVREAQHLYAKSSDCAYVMAFTVLLHYAVAAVVNRRRGAYMHGSAHLASCNVDVIDFPGRFLGTLNAFVDAYFLRNEEGGSYAPPHLMYAGFHFPIFFILLLLFTA